jgi:hypothetical protein
MIFFYLFVDNQLLIKFASLLSNAQIAPDFFSLYVLSTEGKNI